MVLDLVEKRVDEYAERLENNMRGSVQSNTKASTGRLAGAITTEKKSSKITRVGVDSARMGKFDYSEVVQKGRPGGKKLKPKGKKAMSWNDKYGNSGISKGHSQSKVKGFDFVKDAISKTSI